MCRTGCGDTEGSAEQSPSAPQPTAGSDVKVRGRAAQHAVAPGRHVPRTRACFSLCSVFSPKPPLSAAQLPALPRPARRQAPDPAAVPGERSQAWMEREPAASASSQRAARPPPSFSPLPSAHRRAPVTCVPNPGGRGTAWGHDGSIGPAISLRLSVCRVPRPTSSRAAASRIRCAICVVCSSITTSARLIKPWLCSRPNTCN